jgi:hypothetical protein
MFKRIKSKIKQDNDFPERTFILDIYNRFLDGTFYDHLNYHYYEEINNSGETISIFDRRPSVRLRLAKMVVDDSVSLLFGYGHFPTFETSNDELRNQLDDIKKSTNLNEVMTHAATRGSVGSIAILFKIIDGYPSFKPICTQYLTPVFRDDSPDILCAVREKYKVKGKDLFEYGYTQIDIDDHQYYWIERIWDDNTETRFLPYLVVNNDQDQVKKEIDVDRTVEHGLGYIPIAWIKNLGDKNGADGRCTFEAAIENNIEIDYQLSQLGRGLRYSSDPTLVIKDNGDLTDTGKLKKSASRAIVLGEKSDAKYLEIEGKACEAVLSFVEAIRKIALQNVGGNTVNPDKISTAQSGKAIELLYQPLVWLTDRLRVSYGKGLLQLINMVILASHKFEIKTCSPLLGEDEKKPPIKNLDLTSPVSLRWPSFFGATNSDKLQTSQALNMLKNSFVISQETCVKTIANDYAITDIEKEIDQIKKDEEARQEMLAALNPTLTETETI